MKLNALLPALFLCAVSVAEEATLISLSGSNGPYTVERWKRDWPGCEWQDGVSEGNVSFVGEGS